jgi:hydrogenase large subunit
MKKIVIDPITRIEGHQKIEITVDDGVVKDAKSSGMLFRGIELILQGRDPRDANRITQRICGVCPTAHSMASTLCLDDAFGVAERIPDNGRIMRNLIVGSNYLQSHILHFYHLAALDYVDVTSVADYEGTDPELASVKDFIARGELGPFVPRYEGDYRLSKEQNRAAVAHYLQALHMRRKTHELLAVFGGKAPHNCSIVPGGVTEHPTVDKMTSFLWRLNEIRDFVNNVYIPDVIMVAGAYGDHFGVGKGCGNYLSYGVFDLEAAPSDLAKKKRLIMPGITSTDLKPVTVDPGKITEQLKHSWYDDSFTNRHPSNGETSPKFPKGEAYSWIKSPRYDGKPHEVGPLARALVAYAQGAPAVKGAVDGLLGALNAGPEVLFSALGRHAARALEAKLVGDAMVGWVLELKPGEPVFQNYELPDEGTGVGMTCAPRGALGHWIQVKDGVISKYQAVVPTTWNASPRDDSDTPGPMEQAIIGAPVKDPDNPFEVVRIVRSFDPCLACSVHLVTPKGRTERKVAEL